MKKNNKPHFQVTAGLIWQEGKLLITKRPVGSHLAGFWEFPGGKQEEGETLKACLQREVREELGVEILAQGRLLSIDHEYQHQVISLHFFQCCLKSGKPQPLECEELRWVYPRELDLYRFPPPDKSIIDLLKNGSSGK
ncbi:8-oxo-dGTP diphosphatase MutT [Thermodesulfobacteriota bacterium]